MIFLNFKVYEETSGENVLKMCDLVHRLGDKRVAVCLQTTDIFRAKQAFPELEIWAQHADPVGFGKYTGFTAPVSLRAAGAGGILLNHSEHPLEFTVLAKTAAVAKQAGLKVMIIADTLELIARVNELKPDFIGFEDPQLIGGPVAMIEANFDLVKQAAGTAKAPLIVGGGIRQGGHVKKSLEAGGKGVLVASEFAKSSDPKMTLLDLISGFGA